MVRRLRMERIQPSSSQVDQQVGVYRKRETEVGCLVATVIQSVLDRECIYIYICLSCQIRDEVTTTDSRIFLGDVILLEYKILKYL